jgi:glucan phosphorylase
MRELADCAMNLKAGSRYPPEDRAKTSRPITIGDSWIKQLDDLRQLESLVEDAGFQSEFQKVKQANKQDLAAYINAQTGIAVSPESIFDVQVKRLHEYKRLKYDPYLVLADYQAYVNAQQRVSEAYKDRASWTRMSMLNTTGMGRFSSDRAIREYCEKIWNPKPVRVELEQHA